MYKMSTGTKIFQFILGFLMFMNILGIIIQLITPDKDIIELMRSFMAANLLAFFLFESNQKEKAKANGEVLDPGQPFKAVLPKYKLITIAIVATFLISMIVTAYYAINGEALKAALYALASILIYINIVEERFKQIKRKNKDNQEDK